MKLEEKNPAFLYIYWSSVLIVFLLLILHGVRRISWENYQGPQKLLIISLIYIQSCNFLFRNK